MSPGPVRRKGTPSGVRDVAMFCFLLAKNYVKYKESLDCWSRRNRWNPQDTTEPIRERRGNREQGLRLGASVSVIGTRDVVSAGCAVLAVGNCV